MRIEKDRFGDDWVRYDSKEEEQAAMRNYLSGDFAKLTALEIAEFSACENDPLGKRWEREHAGRIAVEDLDEMTLNEFAVVYRPEGESLTEGRQWLRRAIGEHPITAARLWQILRR